MAAEKISFDRDKYMIWPSMAMTIFFLSFLWIYSKKTDFIFFAGILYALVIGLIGLVKLLSKRFRSGISLLIPATLFFAAVFSSSGVNFRMQVIDVMHQARFAFEKEKYESEIKKLKNFGITYKEWQWGDSGTIQWMLVYDESDRIALTQSNSIPYYHPCSRKILKIDTHFYVVDDYCPSAM